MHLEETVIIDLFSCPFFFWRHQARAKHTFLSNPKKQKPQSDPFVTLRLAGREFTSRTIYDSLNPVWNEARACFRPAVGPFSTCFFCVFRPVFFCVFRPVCFAFSGLFRPVFSPVLGRVFEFTSRAIYDSLNPVWNEARAFFRPFFSCHFFE